MKMKLTFPKVKKGGPGSGDFGHRGRPGQIGGSSGDSGDDVPRKLNINDVRDNQLAHKLSERISSYVQYGDVHMPNSVTQKGQRFVMKAGKSKLDFNGIKNFEDNVLNVIRKHGGRVTKKIGSKSVDYEVIFHMNNTELIAH